MTWRPSASIEALRARARLYQQLRTFFAERDVLEIEAPIMGAAAVTDPYIDSIRARCGDTTVYLQPSPEFAMKRDRKSTRLNSSHVAISYAVFCLKKKKNPYVLRVLHIKAT